MKKRGVTIESQLIWTNVWTVSFRKKTGDNSVRTRDFAADTVNVALQAAELCMFRRSDKYEIIKVELTGSISLIKL